MSHLNGTLSNGHHASVLLPQHRAHPPSHLSHITSTHYSHHRPLIRVDVNPIKQELHDALGQNGLPYWKALNGYLMGQIGRGELEGMVREWLKGKTVHLHNKLLVSLLHNASIPPQPLTPSSPMSLKKRKRLQPDDPEYDVDENHVEGKVRVQTWMSGLSGKERMRMRKAAMKHAEAEAEEEKEKDKDPWGEKKKAASLQQGNMMPPMASTERVIPSSSQLLHRLSQTAKNYDLTIAPDAMADIGEFLAIGMDAHVSDVFNGLVHFTGRNRPGHNTVRVPSGVKKDQANGNDEASEPTDDGEVPTPNLEVMRDLFTLNPSLHSSTSPAIYKLNSGLTLAEVDYNSPKVKLEPGLDKLKTGVKNRSVRETEERAKVLVERSLVKIDNAKKDGEEGGKKDKKHNWHWKYEDPAIMLRSVFG